MTTTADFYTGRGRNAAWLGSLQGDADPATVHSVAYGRLMLGATDPFTYADAVTDLLDVWADEGHGHGYHPHGGWPWLWPDSRHTDWVFTFEHGRVWTTSLLNVRVDARREGSQSDKLAGFLGAAGRGAERGTAAGAGGLGGPASP